MLVANLSWSQGPGRPDPLACSAVGPAIHAIALLLGLSSRPASVEVANPSNGPANLDRWRLGRALPQRGRWDELGGPEGQDDRADVDDEWD